MVDRHRRAVVRGARQLPYAARGSGRRDRLGAVDDKLLRPRACWNRVVVAGAGAAAALRQRLLVRRAEADIVAARPAKN